jgi:transcriptional antiterminator NusG
MHAACDGKTHGRGTTATEWFAAYVKHQHERRAALHLEGRGVEVYLPQREVIHRWKDRHKRLLQPLFPGYLFLRSDLRDKFQILNTPGVFHLVESGGHACPIPEQEIGWIRRITESGAQAQPHPLLSTGDRVRICNGPLAGVTGVLTRLKKQYRVVMTVEVLQKALSVEVEISNVERTGDKSIHNPGSKELRRIA